MRTLEEPSESAPHPLPVAAAVGSGVLALVYAVTGFLPPVASDHTLGTPASFLIVALVGLVFTLGLVAATLGLLLRKPWGWVFGLVFHAAGVLYQFRYLFFYLRIINWEHSRSTRLGI